MKTHKIRELANWQKGKNMKKKNDEIEIVEINTEFIKLDQLLKWANFTASGVESKMFILNGEVKVNGEVETRRGKKIYDGYVVEFNGEKIKVKAPKAPTE